MIQIIAFGIGEQVHLPRVIDEVSLQDEEFCDGQKEKPNGISVGQCTPGDYFVPGDDFFFHDLRVCLSKGNIRKIL